MVPSFRNILFFFLGLNISTFLRTALHSATRSKKAFGAPYQFAVPCVLEPPHAVERMALARLWCP